MKRKKAGKRRDARLLGNAWIPDLGALFQSGEGCDFSLPAPLGAVRVRVCAEVSWEPLGDALETRGVRLHAEPACGPAHIGWRLHLSGRVARVLDALEALLGAGLLSSEQRVSLSLDAVRQARRRWLRRKSGRRKAFQEKGEGPRRGKVRWYHVTRKRLRLGTVLVPGYRQNNPWSPCKVVFLTADPVPHFTMHDSVMDDPRSPWHVYEVEPLGVVRRGAWEDAYVERARVVRYVGTGKGLLNRHHKALGLTGGEAALEGSATHPRHVRASRRRDKARQRPF